MIQMEEIPYAMKPLVTDQVIVTPGQEEIITFTATAEADFWIDWAAPNLNLWLKIDEIHTTGSDNGARKTYRSRQTINSLREIGIIMPRAVIAGSKIEIVSKYMGGITGYCVPGQKLALVAQIHRRFPYEELPEGTAVICEECKMAEKTSRVEDLRTSFTSSRSEAFYDETGVRHEHVGLFYQQELFCSNGHRWVRAWYPTCKTWGCGWTQAKEYRSWYPSAMPNVIA